MLKSAWHLFVAAWDAAVSLMGTTTFAIGFGLIVYGIVLLKRISFGGGFKAVKTHLLGDAGLTAATVTSGWTLLVAWCAIVAIYEDHRVLVSKNAELEASMMSRQNVETTKSLNPTLDQYHWNALSAEEQSALRSKLKNVSQLKTVRVICSDSDGRDLADSFEKVFHDLNWQIQQPFYDAGNYGVVGLKIFQDNENDRTIADAIEQATHGGLNVATGHDTYGYITIIIGPKS